MSSAVVDDHARAVLDGAWVPEAGYCLPNPSTYPHLWLWDSCFHSLAWMGLESDRCLDEIAAVFKAQTPAGFVPHMRYRAEPRYSRGPMVGASSFTQPPVFGLTIERLLAAGFAVPDSVIDAATRGLQWLWTHRRTDDDLIFIVHPWESGADDSPRWDAWAGSSDWNRPEWSEFDQRLLLSTTFDDGHAANGSTEFVVAPAAFSAITGYAAARLAMVRDNAGLRAMADRIGQAVDEHLWNPDEQLWNDLALVGPPPEREPSSTWPTLCGVLGALVTHDADRANAALDQVLDPQRFGAPYGVRYVPPGHHAYDPDPYWRGPTWPQMNYLVWAAAHRWERDDVVDSVEKIMVAGVEASGYAEFWNPETGEGRGAIPQSWAAVVTAMRLRFAPR